MLKSAVSARYPETAPKAFVRTFGCQANVADSERLKGMLFEAGFEFCDYPEDADLALFNTCAVREHAEDRVFGNVGAMKPVKEKNRGMIIALCGCMLQQEHIADKIRQSYPFVDLVFGTFAIPRFPSLLYTVLMSGKRVFDTDLENPNPCEGLPIYRERRFKAWLPIMYGCDNFCSYCVVPYVRGRERSREKSAVIEEAKKLIHDGALDITLLGQNVNSYGKNLSEKIGFPELIRELNALDGNFLIRFMTSHPKDCGEELFTAMRDSEKAAKHLHLPFQSGNNRVLNAMNRGYTREDYLRLIYAARQIMPDISVTSDVIVGFPGESYEEFRDTLKLIEEAEFTSLFTFIYSKRRGTAAEKLPDPVPHTEKAGWMEELLRLQEGIAAKRTAGSINKVYKVLAEEKAAKGGYLTGRTEGNVNILFGGGEELIGTFRNIRVKNAENWILYGDIVTENHT
ncbi:MAG: tRNA (N6-isopentenyl adenosine(37)-C2)-methylthiotransferase MiaB [Oscillospiraceae bacterium]|nr:tRNA (N6-isopentenyl adenosine(37)-C2)-methylthiotransferase MiaB [Oscillospiraceae bacterium]